MSELVDVYDENLNLIESCVPRETVHAKGLWHKTFHCWIIFSDENGTDFIVFQRRSKLKDIFPDKLDTTVAGHYQSGENIFGGLREISEEIGLHNVLLRDLIPVGIRVCVDRSENMINHEFQDVFFLIRKLTNHSVDILKEEVDSILLVPIDDVFKLYLNQLDSIIACDISTSMSQEVVITRDDLIISIDNYYLKILMLAKKALRGEGNLFI